MLTDISAPLPSPPLFEIFWQEHRQKVMMLFVGVLVLALLVGGILVLRRSHRMAAEALLSQSTTVEEWQKIVALYPRSGAAANALLLIAAAQGQAHQTDLSNATYARFLEKFPRNPLVISALIGRALNDDAAGHAEQALDELQQASVAYPKSYGAPFALWMRARLLARLGKTEEVKRTLQIISSQYPHSFVTSAFLRQRMAP